MSDIFKGEVEFVAGSTTAARIPNFNLAQIAFVGKSNVGKSSLINSVCRRKKLARTSNTPGRTRQINFFSVGGKFILTDLPGYGYAKVAQSEKRNWEKLILFYLQNNDKLKLVNILIDSRHGIKNNDKDIILLLESFGLNIQLVFTKCDKSMPRAELLENTKACLAEMNVQYPIIFVSSKKNENIKELQNSIISAIKN